MTKLQDQSVIVTGASRGIGRAMAEAFAREGARVIGCGRDAVAGESAMAAIRTEGGRANYISCDVSKEAEVQHLIETVQKSVGRIDVLINNAAVHRESPILEQTSADFRAIMDVNLLGTFLCSQRVLPVMIAQRSGAIINLSSVLGLVGDPLRVAYCASKAGILGLTRATAVAVAEYGIRVNALCPGDVDTEKNRAFVASQSDPLTFRKRLDHEYPMRRIATPTEIARVAVFLASDDSAFVTGTTLVADGGLLAAIYEF